MESFLAIAQELQLQGLLGKSDDDEHLVVEEENMEKSLSKRTMMGKLPSKNRNPVHKKEAIELGVGKQQISTNEQHVIQGTVALPSNFSGDFEELNKMAQSLMEKTSNKKYGFPLYKCTVCGKEAISGSIKKHIEAKHLEGALISCNLCGKTFRCKTSLAKHSQRILTICCFNISSDFLGPVML